MNTPALATQRLILRRFTEGDPDAILAIFSDADINRSLPWFPLTNAEEARAFLTITSPAATGKGNPAPGPCA